MHKRARPFDPGDPEFATLYDEVSLWSVRFGLLLLEHIQLESRFKVLDVACATGFPLFALADRGGPSCQIIGADIWATALVHAERKRRFWGMDHVALVEADGTHLPFPDGYFDLVTSNLGVNNFEDPVAAFAECRRILKHGGRLALATNITGHMREFYAVFHEVLADFGNQDYVERLRVNEAHRGTVESHRRLLEEAGFQIVQMVQDQFTMRFLDGNAFAASPIILMGFLPAWMACVDDADNAAVFEELRRRLNDHARQVGELRLTLPMLYLEGQRKT